MTENDITEMKTLGEALDLLKEAYVFIAMKHRACDPWRNALDDWQSRVEVFTDWKAFEEIKNFVNK